MNKLFAYPGGKWPIRNQVVSVFPKHTTYVDVFGGSAAILLTKEASEGEIFNDKNEMLVNFFRVVKHRPGELAERAKNWIHSRSMWNEVLRSGQPYDEVERAFMFWTRLQDSFGARGQTYGMSKTMVHSVTKSRDYLDEVSKRLKNVHIECCSFEKCIRNYDSPETFFYLDPPYPNTKGGEGNYDLLSLDEWQHLREILGTIKGKFLLSCNDDPYVVKLFKDFPMKKIVARVTLARKKGLPPRTEILSSNYSLPRVNQHTPVYDADRPAIADRRKASKKTIRKERVK
jgi:DNA adenine methylase